MLEKNLKNAWFFQCQIPNAQGNLTLQSLAEAKNVRENHVRNIRTIQPKKVMCQHSTTAWNTKPSMSKKRFFPKPKQPQTKNVTSYALVGLELQESKSKGRQMWSDKRKLLEYCCIYHGYSPLEARVTCEAPAQVQRKSRARGRHRQGRRRMQSSIHSARRISFSEGGSKISGYNFQISQHGRRSQRRGISIHASTSVGSSQKAEVSG